MTLKLVDLFGFFSVILRAGTLVFQSLLLGGVLFVLWVARGSPEASPDGIARVQASSWNLLRLSASGLAVVQLLYLYVNSTVLMVTAEIGIADVVGANFFVAGSIVLAVALLTGVVASGSKSSAKWVLPVLAVVIMSASVMTSHAAARVEGRPLLIPLSCVHELAVGFWIGGLPFLVLGLFRAQNLGTQRLVAQRFSGMALISVGALVLSGTAMSALYIGSWRALFGTAYGVMVGAKAVMLAALLIIGGVNYLLLRNSTKEEALPRLRRLIEAEVGIGITVILTAASLTSQPPAVDQLNAIVTLPQIYQRFKPVVPRLTYEYVTDRTYANLHAAGDTVLPGAPAENLDGRPLTARLINDAIESESNHHWMGLLVLAMGLLALLERTGKAPWAEYWPLLLFGIAIFIFVQADSECWPVGPKGFWACWLNPEAFQHRLAGLVSAGFALFELRVRQQPHKHGSLSLVFPLMCAAGGAALLTHSHPLTNVKENLLVEWSHLSLGIVAVVAGWARWLELQLPEKDRAIPSWIWPACFLLIGLGLLNYREM